MFCPGGRLDRNPERLGQKTLQPVVYCDLYFLGPLHFHQFVYWNNHHGKSSLLIVLTCLLLLKNIFHKSLFVAVYNGVSGAVQTCMVSCDAS